MIPAAIEFGGRYGGLAMPVAIMAGTDDEIVDLARQSRRLHEELPRSALRLVPGGGHMMHHLGAPGRRTRRSGRKPLGNEAGPTTSGRGVTGG
jgi:hypothetical protein